MDLFDEIYTNIDSGNLSSTAFTGTSGGKFVLQTSPTINTSLTLAGATFTQSNSSSGSAVSYSLSNTSNTAFSDAKQVISVGGSSAGNPFTNWNVSGTTDWIAGIDNSDNDYFKIQKAVAFSSDYTVRVVQNGSGGGNELSIRNNNNTASSDAYLMAIVGGSAAGDPMVIWSVSGASAWVAGIDNSVSGDLWHLQKGSAFSDYYLLRASDGGSGGVSYLQISNAYNTAGSGAFGIITVGGSTAGDPYLRFEISGATDWTVGPDNSDSDTFKVCKSSTIGTNTYLQIDTSGAATFNGTLNISSTTTITGVTTGALLLASNTVSYAGRAYGAGFTCVNSNGAGSSAGIGASADGLNENHGVEINVVNGTSNIAIDVTGSSTTNFEFSKILDGQLIAAALGAYYKNIPITVQGVGTYYLALYA